MGAVINKAFCEDDVEGYQILNICEGSPAHVVGLEAYFDFVVAICGVKLNDCPNVLLNLLHSNAGSSIVMRLYSLRSHKYRDVNVTPNVEWGIQGLLGVTIRYCSVREANNSVHHILEVHPDSPADKAGLRPFSDYIIGAEFHTDQLNINFISLISQYDGKKVKLFLYNYDNDACRSVAIEPNSKWGGEGLIGCGIGIGYLHRIPSQLYTKESSSVSVKFSPVKAFNAIISTILSTEEKIISPTILYSPPLKKIENFVDLESNIQIEPTMNIDEKDEKEIGKAEKIFPDMTNLYHGIDLENQDKNEETYIMMMP